MLREHMNSEPPFAAKESLRRVNRRESVLGALALLLGTETEETNRIRAVRRLARAGMDETNLLLLLRAMSEHPEITSPPWPCEPPQYASCGRLLYLLSRNLRLPLDAFLTHPALAQPVGPVLWAAMIEAVSLMPAFIQRSEYEPLLRAALLAPWVTVRYSAAMALANLARKVRLSAETVRTLRREETEALPVLIAASCALLRMQEEHGLDMLLRLLEQDTLPEGRRAAAFVLTMEQPVPIAQGQRERLARQLLLALHDPDEQVAQHAAHALSAYGSEEMLAQLCSLLDTQQSTPAHSKVAALLALEEMMSSAALREIMQRGRLMATTIVPLLQCETPEVRQQASYTLATIGGSYAATVLGAIISDAASPAYLDAIEGLRLLHGALSLPRRPHVVRWLLSCLQTADEQARISALDSLAYLAWQARGQHRALLAYSKQIAQDDTLEHLLISESAWVRQRTLELVGLLHCQRPTLYRQVLHCLRHDTDSGVRACAAYVISQLAPHWATSSTFSPIPDLILALTDPDVYVAETALNTLALLTSNDHPFVVYALKEITAHGYAEENNLFKAAQALLKKWGICDVARLPPERYTIGSK